MTTATEISPADLSQALNANGDYPLIDVRDFDEYEAFHVQGATNIPMPRLIKQASQWDTDTPLTLICYKGVRATEAATELEKAGFTNLKVVQGGTKACEKDNLSVVRGRKRLPVMRQVQLTVGSMILCGLIGSLFYTPAIVLCWIGGLGLIMAGITGLCPLASLIAKTPWNRAAGATEATSCCSSAPQSADAAVGTACEG
jgi:rhodanese-related sulfurtransferase